jgi:hypothetical protein
MCTVLDRDLAPKLLLLGKGLKIETWCVADKGSIFGFLAKNIGSKGERCSPP